MPPRSHSTTDNTTSHYATFFTRDGRVMSRLQDAIRSGFDLGSKLGEDQSGIYFTNAAVVDNPSKWVAYLVYGDIYRRWRSLGGTRSWLGHPVGEEEDFSGNGRVTVFQNGEIYWFPDIGAVDLREVIVGYAGLQCYGTTGSNLNDDEPYFVLSADSIAGNSTFRTRIYEDVNERSRRSDWIELYRGKPHGLVVSAVLMEHDLGDPNAYRDEIQGAMMALHKAGVFALNFIPIVGGAVSMAMDAIIGPFVPQAADAINEALGTGDVHVGTSIIPFSGGDLVRLGASQEKVIDGVKADIETQLISGHGGSYKGYFTVFASR